MSSPFAALWLLASFAGADPKPADVILHNGKVLTVDADFRIAEALAIRGDRIEAVGKNADVLRLKGPETQVIDLAGRTVIPGLTDSHVHPSGASMYEFDHPVPDIETIGDLLKYIEARTKVVPEGEWIQIRQVFITRLRDQRYPTRKELDLVAPKHPVSFATGPDASLNSLALKLSGIDRDFQITDGKPGFIEKDEAGEPTGILRSCTRLIKATGNGRQSTETERLDRLRELLAAYNAVGITSITDRDAGDGAVELYEKLKERGELSCRVYLHYSVDAQAPIDDIRKRLERAGKSPLHERNAQLWLRGIKVYLDGGMLTGSAYMRQPWGVSSIYSITDPEYRGVRFIPADKLEQIVRLAVANDLQMTAHSVGDGAVHALIDAYAAVNRDIPIHDKRLCITHCNFMSREAIERMHELNIVADLQPAWLYLDGRTLLRQFGNERLAYFQPYRSLFEQHVHVGGGSDHMQKIGSLRSINPYNPYLGMWTTVTRRPRGMDEPLHPEQSLSREQALQLYTINNAYLTFEEQEKGSLEPGKLADFVILQQDYLKCPVEEIRDITVSQTWLGGKRIYAAGSAGKP